MQTTQQLMNRWELSLSVAVAGMWVKLPNTVQILLWCMLFDIISGLFAGIANRRLNSSIMLKGLCQKALIFPLLGMLQLVEAPLKLSFDFGSVAACFFIAMEAMSIIENAARGGVPIPSVIVNAFAKAKIQTTNADDIQREFAIGDRSTLSIGKSSGIVKAPGPLPDLKVTTTDTRLTEKHVEPVEPPKA